MYQSRCRGFASSWKFSWNFLMLRNQCLIQLYFFPCLCALLVHFLLQFRFETIKWTGTCLLAEASSSCVTVTVAYRHVYFFPSIKNLSAIRLRCNHLILSAIISLALLILPIRNVFLRSRRLFKLNPNRRGPRLQGCRWSGRFSLRSDPIRHTLASDR